MPHTAFPFKAASKTFAVAMTDTGSTPVQITAIQGVGALQSPTISYYVVNKSAGFLFFVLSKTEDTAALPADASSAAGYMLPPNSAATFVGPTNAYFSGDLDTGTGSAYVCAGEGL